MNFKKVNRIHFMGVGGSGTSGIVILAKKNGFSVDGCNLEKDNPYVEKVRKEGIKVFYGHNKNHLGGADLIVATPAVLLMNKNHPEVLAGKKIGLITAQKFLGDYLQSGKEVVAISGTHGKTTTTALAGLILEKGKFDPSVFVGGAVAHWKGNFRYGKGNAFVTEADEFYDNFLSYSPSIAIINNIELDHPDYFKNEKDVLTSFKKFVKRLTGQKVLILNLDSEGVRKLYRSLDRNFVSTLKVFGYTLEQSLPLDVGAILYGAISEEATSHTTFSVSSNELGITEIFRLRIPGEYNVANALGVILLAKVLDIDFEKVREVFLSFEGVERRLELLGEKKGVMVYDDYAHHPTAISATLGGLRQKFPAQRIWAIVEPHSFSRTKTLLKNYSGVFEKADKVIIAPIFQARDTKNFGVTGESIVKVANHKDILYLSSFGKTTYYLKKNAVKNDVVIVMGAGKSYLLARDILKRL